MAAKKKAAKKPAKKAAKKAVKKVAKKKTARKPNAAFMKPVQPDAILGAIVGDKGQPRTEIMKKVWVYIKKNNLQDKKNRRQINADANLKALFGGKASVTMFEMTKYIFKHAK
ncbi:MAG: SWIB/MDM2 domain-containing protein [Gemmatimonadaceae bacterium]|jgi:chromatin remodeling complex protein RSC6